MISGLSREEDGRDEEGEVAEEVEAEEVEAYKDGGCGGGRAEHAGGAYKEGFGGAGGEHAGRKSRRYMVTWKVGRTGLVLGIICRVGIIHMSLDGVCEGEGRGSLLTRCYTHESLQKNVPW